MNIIGIDSSKVSSAMAIKSNKGEFLFNYTTKKENYKWIKKTKDIVNYYHFNYDLNGDENYSDGEVKKLIAYSYVSNKIVEDALKCIDHNDESIIRIEGYSFGSGAGDIIDLVGIGQSIRIKLIESIPKIKNIEILAPKRLKTLCCEYAYGKPEQAISEKTGKPLKKWIPSTNNDGIRGGDFTKHEMLKAIKESNLKSPLTNFYKENYDEIYSLKTIQKPIEDLNDAIWLVNVKNT
jgi:hypothetical protein